ncbi:MAG: hypothetical protein AB8H12_03225 [Lewinella sp.]
MNEHNCPVLFLLAVFLGFTVPVLAQKQIAFEEERVKEDYSFYGPPRIQRRTSNGLSDRHIGNTIGLFVKYSYSKYLGFDIRSSYFVAGSFIGETGPAASIFQFAPTVSLTF